MGWRDELQHIVGTNIEPERDGFHYVDHAAIAQELLAMPDADRIALARELLAGTDRVVARNVGPKPAGDSTYLALINTGWDACRAAMMEVE